MKKMKHFSVLYRVWTSPLWFQLSSVGTENSALAMNVSLYSLCTRDKTGNERQWCPSLLNVKLEDLINITAVLSHLKI